LQSERFIRWSGAALLLGGVAIALFVIVLYPVGGFFGAQRARDPLWVPAHTLHLIGALLTLFGVVGLYGRQIERTGPLGAVGFAIAFVGTALFVGTGMLTTFVWPVLAAFAPATLELDGALFVRPAGVLFGVTILTLIPGYLLLGLATFRAGVLPRGGALLLMVGVVFAIAPPPPVGPFPWIGLVVGGVLFGAGAAWLGYSLWSTELPRPLDQAVAVDLGDDARSA